MKRLIGWCCLLLALPAASPAGDGAKNDSAARKPIRISGEQKAPEFADITDWINSEPLTMKDLKGKVVVVHFMAFG
jgi:hypothetical protein